jgi:hypothetical protein
VSSIAAIRSTREKLEYYIIAEAVVDGAMFATQDKKKIEIVP